MIIQTTKNSQTGSLMGQTFSQSSNFIQKNIHYVSRLNKLVKDKKITCEKEPVPQK